MDSLTRRLAQLGATLRDFGRRRRTPITVVGSLVTLAVLAYILAGKRQEVADALSSAAAWGLGVAVLLQIVALVARSGAWHLSIEAAGGTLGRRMPYPASGMGVL